MERRSADDWDGVKLENLAKNYMGMRREIWSGLAAQTGEKWNVVEQKVLLSSWHPSIEANLTSSACPKASKTSRQQPAPAPAANACSTHLKADLTQVRTESETTAGLESAMT
jgi:hypothetical protein